MHTSLRRRRIKLTVPHKDLCVAAVAVGANTTVAPPLSNATVAVSSKSGPKQVKSSRNTSTSFEEESSEKDLD